MNLFRCSSNNGYDLLKDFSFSSTSNGEKILDGGKTANGIVLIFVKGGSNDGSNNSTTKIYGSNDNSNWKYITEINQNLGRSALLITTSKFKYRYVKVSYNNASYHVSDYTYYIRLLK